MATTATFPPPYLDYGVPADLKKIQAEIAAMLKSGSRSPGRFDFAGPVSGLTASANPRGGFAIDPTKLQPAPATLTGLKGGSFTNLDFAQSGSPARSGVARGKSFPIGDIAQFQPIKTEAAAAPPSAASKVAATLVTVAPNGRVLVGFNCSRTFKAEAAAPGFVVSHMVWRMLVKNKQGGTNQLYYIGWMNPSLTENPFPVFMEFAHVFETYSMMAYTSPTNTVEFLIECQYYPSDSSIPIRTETSAPVTLDFNVQSCLSIHSVSVNKDSFVGGDNGREPTLTVTLNKPAGPTGQRVALSTSNRLGRIMHTRDFSGTFLIPAGQISGSVSWFLGTDKVITTGRSFHIKATLVSPGGQSNEGVVEIKLTKPPKK